MIRVLHIVGKMHRAGQETFIMNLYRNIDRSKIQFDFAVGTEEPQDYDDEIRALGGNIYYVTPMSQGVWKHYKSLKKLLNGKGYNIIHRHTANSYVFVDLLAAKACGVKHRYIHSHSNFANHKLINCICRYVNNTLATERFACSNAAGIWLYGKNKKFTVIKNAIETSKYIFDKKKKIPDKEYIWN